LARLAPQAVVVFDGDEAGMRAALRSLEIFLREKVPARLLKLPGGMDPDDFMRQKGKEAFLRLLSEARPLLEAFLEETLEDYDGSVAGKIRSVRTMEPMLKHLDSPPERESYLRFLDRRLGLSEEVLRQELGWTGVATAMRLGAKGDTRLAPPLSAMEEVIRILIHYPQWTPLLEDSQALAHVQDPLWHQLGQLLTRQYRETGKLDVGGLLVGVQDETLRRRVSAWSLEATPWTEEDVGLRLPSLLEKIKDERWRLEHDLKDIKGQIELAERDGNDELLARLLGEFSAKKRALLTRKVHGKANLTKGEMD
jgi:DNA primase